MSAAGIDMIVEEAIESVMIYPNYISDFEITKAFFEKTAETIDWIDEIGVGISEVTSLGDSVEAWHLYKEMVVTK